MKGLQRIRFILSLSYGLFRVFFQVVYGAWKISRLPRPIVSIFGGSRFVEKDPYFQQAYQLAQKLVEQEISIVTGAGPGIMQAANCGVVQSKGGKGRSIGISVKDLPEEPDNPCVEERFDLDFFWARKWLLTQYSQVFIVFPGGYGTLDELFEVLTLIQTKKLKPVPIILIGTEFWHLFMEWLSKEVLKQKAIRGEDLQLFFVTDDLEKALCIVREECKNIV